MNNTEVILTRGISKKSKKALSSIAKKNRCSVNFVMLQAIDFYLTCQGHKNRTVGIEKVIS
jgi:hypothetical protein